MKTYPAKAIKLVFLMMTMMMGFTTEQFENGDLLCLKGEHRALLLPSNAASEARSSFGESSFGRTTGSR